MLSYSTTVDVTVFFVDMVASRGGYPETPIMVKSV